MSDELEQQDDLEVQQGDVQVEPTSTNIKDPLRKYNLQDKWKTDDPVELVDEMGKAYTNAYETLRQREQELAQMRQFMFQQQQPPPQKQEPSADPNENPEIVKARQFVLDTAKGEFEKVLTPLRQQLEQTQTELYVSKRLASPQEKQFQEVVFSGELGSVMQNMNLPYTPQAVDYAFNALMYRKMSDVVAANREDAKVQGASLEQQKQRTFMESGAKSQRQQIPSMEQILKDTANMSEAEYDDYCKKKGIKMPT